jgi:hypothetical protein
MTVQIEIVSYEGIDRRFLAQIRAWANEVLEKANLLSTPPYMLITIWKNNEELLDFYRNEKEALGVVTGEEIEFLATHEAWRGYPRVHISQERIKGISDSVIQGVLHHEIGHTLLHGSPEFYEFHFTNRLQEAGLSKGIDLPILQQCVYFLSIAIKDLDVVKWLAELGLGYGQQALLEYLMIDTEEEQQVWDIARNSPIHIRIAVAAFLKIILAIEAMISVAFEGAQDLKGRWYEAYSWLSERERTGLFRLCQKIAEYEGRIFQERLEYGALQLITEPFN